ncbi:MAG TPA: Hsp70 family protein, partial [Polyangiaceae bacterium]|nr:Hsp70 family protein [Polyangiaceae bacterium]
MSGAHIGIDLGTTYSLVATLVDDEPQVLENAVGELLTPSAVSLTDDGELLVGAVARARATTHPKATALAFKRDMGTDRLVSLGDREMRPEELSALVLGALKRDAEAVLGQSIAEAVGTGPAYFGELGRRATRDACELAGLHVERIINEPTAAALAYGLHERHREMRAVVLDLGGGTFDVTVLEIMEGVIEIQASAGDSRLGGEDFVDRLSDHVVAELRQRYDIDLASDPRGLARVRDAVEMAKRRLSKDARTQIALPRLGASARDVELELTLDQAEELWQPLLGRVRGPIRRALGDAGLKPEDVDEVLLVGGATRMPCVVQLAATLFGRLPLRTLPPDFAVAHGAAIQAALKRGDAAVADMVVTDVAPFTLGIAVGDKVGSHEVSGLFAPILDRGT